MKKLIPGILVLAALVAGCSRSVPPPAVQGAPSPAPALPELQQPEYELASEPWAKLAVRLRYKAGVYHDVKQGLIYITLYEPDARAEAEKAVAEMGLSQSSVVMKEAEFDRAQLGQWYRQINWGEGVVTGWVDESVNRIRFGVTTVESRERLEAAIRKAGVPLEAVFIDLPEGALSEADPLKGCQVETLPTLDWEKPSKYGLQLEPSSLASGQTFTITARGAAPNELTRGIDAYLECWDGSAWTPRYTLWSHDPPSASIYSANRVINDIGFDASRPGRFVLPDGLKPGWYRIRLHASGTVDGRYQPYDLWTLVQIGQ
jgi:hypothetical protein